MITRGLPSFDRAGRTFTPASVHPSTARATLRSSPATSAGKAGNIPPEHVEPIFAERWLTPMAYAPDPIEMLRARINRPTLGDVLRTRAATASRLSQSLLASCLHRIAIAAGFVRAPLPISTQARITHSELEPDEQRQRNRDPYQQGRESRQIGRCAALLAGRVQRSKRALLAQGEQGTLTPPPSPDTGEQKSGAFSDFDIIMSGLTLGFVVAVVIGNGL